MSIDSLVRIEDDAKIDTVAEDYATVDALIEGIINNRHSITNM